MPYVLRSGLMDKFRLRLAYILLHRIADDPGVGNFFCPGEPADLLVIRARKGDGEAWGLALGFYVFRFNRSWHLHQIPPDWCSGKENEFCFFGGLGKMPVHMLHPVCCRYGTSNMELGSNGTLGDPALPFFGNGTGNLKRIFIGKCSPLQIPRPLPLSFPC